MIGLRRWHQLTILDRKFFVRRQAGRLQVLGLDLVDERTALLISGSTSPALAALLLLEDEVRQSPRYLPFSRLIRDWRQPSYRDIARRLSTAPWLMSSQSLVEWVFSTDQLQSGVQLATRPDLTSEAASLLATTSFLEIRATLAANPAAPADILKTCFQSSSPDIYLALARHPSTPGSVLAGLSDLIKPSIATI